MFCYVRRISYAILVGFLWASSAPAEIIQFAATLDGVQADECNGTGSAGTGSGAFALDTETGVVSYEITFTGLGSPENAAHVHGPAEACADAGILYGLPSGSPKVDISPPLTAEEQADMRAGRHYVNIHSDTFSGGEIRGQILEAPDIPTISEWGLVTMTLLALVVGTIVLRRGARRTDRSLS